ncbi:MAG: hypothetical protein WB524_11605 [Acidobacteriaceae bacterium]
MRLKRWVPVILLICLGIVPDIVSELRHFTEDSDLEIAMIVPAIVDSVLLLIIFLLKRSDPAHARRLWDRISSSTIFFMINVFPMILSVFAFCRGLYNLFHLGFWRELSCAAVLSFLQSAYVSRLRWPLRIETVSRRPRRLLALFEGTAATLGLYWAGCILFFFFHLCASGLLSHEASLYVEETASAISERLEHPFGSAHPGIRIWLMFAIAFCFAACWGSRSLNAVGKFAKSIESIFEALVCSFLWFSVMTVGIEDLGLRNQERLALIAEIRFHAADDMQHEVLNLSAPEKQNLLNVSFDIVQFGGESSEVARKTVSIAQDADTDKVNYSSSPSKPQHVTLETVKSLFVTPPRQESDLAELQRTTDQTEVRAKAATSALQEVLTGKADDLGRYIFPTDSIASTVLVSAVADFLSDSGEQSIESVCHKVIAVFSGKVRPPSYAGGGEVDDIVKTAAKEVADAEALPDGSKPGDPDPMRQVRPVEVK